MISNSEKRAERGKAQKGINEAKDQETEILASGGKYIRLDSKTIILKKSV